MFDHPDFDGHELLVHGHDAATGLRAIVAIHSTALGPAFGGCRMRAYAGPADALTDALRLSRGMTFKAAICALPWGGGKAVILGDPARAKTKALLLAMARLIESLGGRYVTADDVGTTLQDLAVMREVTRHTAAATAAAQAPLPVTAHGVLAALEAAVRHVMGRCDLTGLRVAVQGLGQVGLPLARLLHARGVVLTVADLDPARTITAAAELGATVVPPERVHAAEVDVLAPCALGGTLDARTIPELRAVIVCGGANNQLARAADADLLAQHGIVWIPDYLAGAGGVIDFHPERIDDRPEAVLAAVQRIGAITADVLARAAATGTTPVAVADALVQARLAAAASAHAR